MLSGVSAEWVTAGASVFAAIGTVGAVCVALWQIRRYERTSVDVRCSFGYDLERGDLTPIMLVVATNAGLRPVQATGVALRGRNGKLLLQAPGAPPGSVPFMIERGMSGSDALVLQPGESMTTHFMLGRSRQAAAEGFKRPVGAVVMSPVGSYSTRWSERRRLKEWWSVRPLSTGG